MAPTRLGPREERLSWPDYHMLLALVASGRSPDPNTQVGAVLVNKQNQILATGYNGFPRGITTNVFPWDRDKENPLDNKYAYVVHAEKNAVVNANASVAGATCYVTMFPCNECAKDLIQAGVKKIVYLENPYKDGWQSQAAERMFQHLDIQMVQHRWSQPSIESYLEVLCQRVSSQEQS